MFINRIESKKVACQEFPNFWIVYSFIIEREGRIRDFVKDFDCEFVDYRERRTSSSFDASFPEGLGIFSNKVTRHIFAEMLIMYVFIMYV